MQVGVVYREDIPELRAACEAAIANLKAELLTVAITVKYNSSDAAAVEGACVCVCVSVSEREYVCVGGGGGAKQ